MLASEGPRLRLGPSLARIFVSRICSEQPIISSSAAGEETFVPVWHSSLTAAQSRSLDRAQRVAMAAITGRWEPSHTLQLLELGLDRLGARRDRICKRFAERTARSSRHQDMFTPIQTNTRRGAQGTRYAEIRARTGTYYKSALPYLTRILNQ